MSIKNRVISGEYQGCSIGKIPELIYIKKGLTNITISKRSVLNYLVIDQNTIKNTSSIIARGALGAFVLGGIGALVGGLTAKTKNIHTVAIEFKDGKKSILELDDEYYKILLASLF